MNAEQLFLKLMIRRHMMGSPTGRYRSMVLNNFPRVPRELTNAVLDDLIREGAITVSTGERGAVRLVWDDAKFMATNGVQP